MRLQLVWTASALAALGLALPAPLPATDVDGPNDCTRIIQDWGDAPEGSDAYPGGVIGHFPTCAAFTPPGNQTSDCTAISSAPGQTGYVTNVNDLNGYWLGCAPVGSQPLGIDSDITGTTGDGKVNSTGGPVSFCNPNLAIDCVEPAFGMNFGQDERYGSDDAGIATAITFACCANATVTFKATNCGPTRTCFLNILVDWNEDGDWNDNFRCSPTGPCAYEWAVKNAPLTLPSGCTSLTSPSFLTGPRAGRGWMRITICDQPVSDPFPWAGSVPATGGVLRGGETEDYPVTIVCATDPCTVAYTDFGDAPEEVPAYPTVATSHFPTCISPSGAGTQQSFCTAISAPPGPTGYIKHVAAATDPNKFWLGCGPAAGPPGGVDSESDGKTNQPSTGISACSPNQPTDCIEAAFGLTFDQDECYGDADAGIAAALSFKCCSNASVTFQAYNCGTSRDVFLNILVDWNEDADWNDNFQCPPTGCAYEWAVKNVAVPLPHGCTTLTSPSFLTGPRPGHGWLRISLTQGPVPEDYPWNGSASTPNASFQNGETEDYPVTIVCPEDPCHEAYKDFGDAPEGLSAYPSGILGHFPTCIFGTPPGSQELECPPSLSTPPGVTGYVEHVSSPADPFHFWLGCGGPLLPTLGVDAEDDGKVNLAAAAGTPSVCNTGVLVDCVEPAFGMSFGQDECYGDADAGLASPPELPVCDLASVNFRARNCEAIEREVYLNILCDWNGDGDWNDMLLCASITQCAPEWAVKNALVILPPGCTGLTSPKFRVGPKAGPGWLRITLTPSPVPDDFPWAGSAGLAGGFFRGGETEDYPVTITPSLIGVGDRRLPEGLSLATVSPNPSRDGITVRFALPRDATVSLGVFDVAGRMVIDLAEGMLPAGEQSRRWNFRDASGAEVPVGLYIIKLEAEGRVLTQRAIRVK